MRKYVHNKKILILAKSLVYRNDRSTLRNILAINKLTNKLLKRRVYKKALKLPDITIKIRAEIWTRAFLKYELVNMYADIKKNRLKRYLLYGNSFGNTIKLDVIRSFHNYDEKTQEVCSCI